MATLFPAPAAPSSGNATLALVLGILGVLGGLGSCCCCAFLVLAACAPFAWVLGHRELAAIREGRAPASGGADHPQGCQSTAPEEGSAVKS